MPSVLHYAAATIKPNAHFQTAGLLTTDAPAGETLQVRCLLFYEGKHTSMEGKATTYNADKIRAIATATNAWIAGGRRIKLYAGSQDHYISQSSTIGFLVGDVTAEEITENTLPMLGLTDLIGKMGIFGLLQISGSGNVEQYRDGRLKELSVGIAATGEIVEVSAVSIPSLAGAVMYAAANPPTPEQAWAHAEAALAYALTLSDQLQDDAVRTAEAQLWRLWEAFTSVLDDIRRAANNEPDELNGQTPEALRSKAVEDFATQLRNRLQVPAALPTPDPLTTIPLFGASMDLEQMSARIETLETADKAKDRQIALFARRETLADRFTAARTKGAALVVAGKMTPADFKDKFESETQGTPAIAQFSAAQVEDAETALNGFERDLTGLEYYLGQLDKFAKATKFGMPFEGRDLDSPERQEQEIEAEATRLVESASRFGRIV